MVDNAHQHRTSPTAASPFPSRVSTWWAVSGPVLCRQRIGVAATVVTAGAFGLAAGWWTPRGPIITPEALTTIGLSLLVGAFAGLVMRSRWAMLLGPVAFAVVFELARIGTDGPMVDGIHPGSTYGIVALVSGRGVHALLALLPMLLGATLGAAAARHLDRGRQLSAEPIRPGRWVRRVFTVLAMLGSVTLAAALVRPARTAAIVGADGKPVAGSVAELARVQIGGHDLAVLIRGTDAANPVLLFLAGGPGGTEMGAMRRHGQALEQDFVVATFDQRGTGKSYDNLEPTATLTLAQAVRDTVEVTNYLRDRFHQDKIYVVANSWGTILGVLAVQQHPELFHAFVGSGQMVSVLYPQLQDIDFRTDVPKLDVPVYLVQGRHELPGRAVLADQWFRTLDAPTKEMLIFDTAGHRSLFERPDLFHQVMTETVLHETQSSN